ncbi:hypothetical protein OS493_018608 [Desmophyllum pertusum]|uniref:Rotatin N-terminal domain-containing protein n=1 Tax=Desmophyllum pertusum TaxID=174260 RepID=A0A9W9ZNP6_9CNID|nr:hypothetical protein OS493_018608 [Desmophyllum pertusum]
MGDGTKFHARTDQVIIPANCVALQPFIAKLGHNVEEIRVRALKNILFKLDHKKEVLGILETLSKPVSGAEGLLSIGAIEFLSHLRQDVDPELHQSVDNVIHQLLSLPQDDAVDHDQQCLYKEHNPGHWKVSKPL